MKTLRFILHNGLITIAVIALCCHSSSAQNSFPTPTGPCVLDATGAGAGSGGQIRLSELDANGANYFAIKAPDALAGNQVYTWPNAIPSTGKVLSSDATGVLTWVKRAKTDLSNLDATTSINSDLLPNATNTLDLGSSAAAWRNGYFLGSVGIGTTSPTSSLHINAASGNALRVQIAGVTKLLVGSLGGVSIGSTTEAPSSSLFVSGDVGIGTSAPTTKLQITGGVDASLTGLGFMQIGATNVANIVFDDNEIIARSNGAESTLFLQNNGGDLNVSAGALLVTGATNVVTTSTNMVVGGTIDVLGSTVSFGSVEFIQDGGSNLIVASDDFATDVDGTNSLGTSANTWFDVWATDASINTSDIRLKENIADIKYGLSDIMKMHPVSYTWKQHPDAGTKLGLIAQEMQPILPEVVRDWEYSTDEQTGLTVKTPSVKLGIQYESIIPVLIKGIQEQQNQIAEKDAKITTQQKQLDDQQQQIQQLSDRLATLESGAINPGSTDGTARFSMTTENAQPVLGQNIPNPFENSTLIPFRLPMNCKDASLQITESITGRILRVTPLVCGETQISIDAGLLSSGTYTYSLYVDGNLIDTKQMILTK